MTHRPPERGLSLLASAAGLMIWVLAPHVANAQSREESLRTAELDRRAALLAADTVALSRLVATEFYEITRFGTMRPRGANMREISSGALKLQTIQYDSTTVHVYGDVGVLSAIADNTGVFQGTPFSGKIRYTRVFAWRDGRWQAVMMQQTPIQPPAP